MTTTDQRTRRRAAMLLAIVLSVGAAALVVCAVVFDFRANRAQIEFVAPDERPCSSAAAGCVSCRLSETAEWFALGAAIFAAAALVLAVWYWLANKRSRGVGVLAAVLLITVPLSVNAITSVQVGAQSNQAYYARWAAGCPQ
jgi:hypothetical protein